MTPDQRFRYASQQVQDADLRAGCLEAHDSDITLEAVRDLLDVALDFPKTLRAQGLYWVAERWCRTDGAIALAGQLERPSRPPAPTPIVRALRLER
jgi:hypothetical protein